LREDEEDEDVSLYEYSETDDFTPEEIAMFREERS
jgi:hypothetical protein